MRQDYAQFQARGAEIIAIGPDNMASFRRYWQENDLPFPGCADEKSRVATLYQQKVNWLKFGRMPALLVIDREGRIRYSHFGNSMSDIPANQDVLNIIDHLSD